MVWGYIANKGYDITDVVQCKERYLRQKEPLLACQIAHSTQYKGCGNGAIGSQKEGDCAQIEHGEGLGYIHPQTTLYAQLRPEKVY
jgi:hypothetical protein